MLEQFYDDVDVRIYPTDGLWNLLLCMVKGAFFGLFRSRSYDLVSSWFVGYHSFMPFLFSRLMGTRTVAFLGGTECHKFPEYNHGNYRKPLYAWFTSRSLRLANFIFPVHETLIRSRVDYVEAKFPEQGILAFNRSLRGKVEALHCGFETETGDMSKERTPGSFLSVSSYLHGKTYLRKGIDMVVALAEKHPEFHFTLVGSGYKGQHLKNLKVYDRVSYDELKEIYKKHEFYLQLSIAEGFPNALAEAMLYGCIPIGSSVFGIPDIIADCGYVLQKKDVEKASALITQANSRSKEEKEQRSACAQDRIKNNYTFEKRYEKFKSILNL